MRKQYPRQLVIPELPTHCFCLCLRYQKIYCFVQHMQHWRNFFISDFFISLFSSLFLLIFGISPFLYPSASCTVIALTVVEKVLTFFSYFLLLLSLPGSSSVCVMLIPLPWIPQLYVVFVENAQSTSMQLLAFTIPASLIFARFSISSSFCRISLQSYGSVHMNDLCFLWLVGRLDSAFRHRSFLGFFSTFWTRGSL